jgi:hypothetical protein
MKRAIYFMGLLLLTGAMVFTSCNKDDDDPVDINPNLAFMGGADYTSSDATFIVGEAFKVGVNASENANSGKKLVSFVVVRTFNNVPTTVLDSSFSSATFTWEDNLLANAEVGTERWTFTVTDKDGVASQLAFVITTEAGTTDLGAAEAFVWQRVGAAAGTGLDGFGLKWTSNGKEVMAQIKKDMAEKFVQLDAAAWTTLVTVEDLAAAVEAGTDMAVFTGISAEASKTYDYVLATKYNGEYFLIHITDATVVVETAGTTITINGMFKQ